MRESLKCKCCGKGDNLIQPELLKRLEQLEKEVGSIVISSGYRCPKHNAEVGGEPNSAHTKGYAIDIACKDGREVRRILTRALPIFNRIGISAKATGRFIHVDCSPELPQNTVWSY